MLGNETELIKAAALETSPKQQLFYVIRKYSILFLTKMYGTFLSQFTLRECALFIPEAKPPILSSILLIAPLSSGADGVL